MIKSNLFAAIATAIFAISAVAVPHESGSLKAPVAVEIQYVSIGTGVDGKLRKAIENALVPKMMSQQIEYIKTSGWGKEGESTVCIQHKTYEDAQATYDQVQSLITKSSKKVTHAQIVGTCDSNVEEKLNE